MMAKHELVTKGPFKVENLCSWWAHSSKKLVFSNVSFTLPQYSITALCGINGSGKSTLLSVMAGILPNNLHSSGDVSFCENSIFPLKNKEKAQIISYLVQKETNIWDISVQKLVESGLYPHQKWYETSISSQDESLIYSTLYTLGLQDFSNRPLSSLSGGELQRVRIARSLVQQTSFLFLDEPLAGLDLLFQKELILLLKSLTNENGNESKNSKTVFLSIHDINFASLYVENLVLLKKDRSGIFSGNANEILTKQVIKEVYGEGFSFFEHPICGNKQIY